MKKDETYYLAFMDNSIEQIKSTYNKCIQKFNIGKQALAAFEIRYNEFLAAPILDMESFFDNELRIAKAIYDNLCIKDEENELRPTKSSSMEQTFNSIAEEQANKIKIYPNPLFVISDDELDKLFGFINRLYNDFWEEAEFIFRKKYKIGNGSPLQQIIVSLYDYLPRHEGDIPYAAIAINSAFKRKEHYKNIEVLKNSTIREAAIQLNRLLNVLNNEVKDTYHFANEDLKFLATFKQEVDMAVFNFRLTAFSSSVRNY